MDCYSEESLELAATRLVKAVATPTTKPLGAVPQDLVPLLDHLRGCTRCGELFGLFREIEERLSGRILELRPLRSRKAERTGDAASGPRPDQAYALAASSSDVRKDGAPGQTRVLTLATTDERYLVRIFPNESGVGATAVLIQFHPPENELEPALAPRDSEIVLQVDGVDFRFDEQGIALLPGFPTGGVTLVLRKRAD